MALLTVAQAQTYIGNVSGATTSDTDIATRTLDALRAAVEEWNTRRNWRFLLMDNAASPISVVAGTDVYQLASTLKQPYAARLLTIGRTLVHKDVRIIDRMFADQSAPGTPYIYSLYNPTGFDATAPVIKVKLYPIPAAADSLLVRWYRLMTVGATGSPTPLDILERYQYSLLELARYYFLRDDDAENPRTGEYKERAEKMLRSACADDDSAGDDREVSLISQREWAEALRFNTGEAAIFEE